MTIFELVARERARVARLVRADAWTRAIVALAAALTLGALLLGGSRWIELPRVVPFIVWVVAISAAAFLIRRGARALRRVAASEAIADEVEHEQRLRRGAVRGIIELSDDTSAFVARAAQRLGDHLASRGSSLAPELQRRLRRGALAGAAVLVPVLLIATFVAARQPDGFRALAHPVDAWRGALLPRLEIADAPSRAARIDARAHGACERPFHRFAPPAHHRECMDRDRACGIPRFRQDRSWPARRRPDARCERRPRGER